MGRFRNDKKQYFFITAKVYLLFLLVFSLLGDRGLITSLSLWGQKQSLQSDIQQLKKQIDLMQNEIQAFSSQDRRLYEYAREKMNMQQDHEIQYIFREKI